MKLAQSFLSLALIGSALFAGTAQAQVKVDKKLPSYQPTTGVEGNINSVGSDTMNNLMALWAEGFNKHYKNVQVEVIGKGSSTAPPALIKGNSTFGPMSREMKSEEIDAFKKEYGYEPTKLPTSIDMLAVYVHKDNPISGLTLQQVDAIFSKTRKGGASEDITTWGQLGLTGEWADKPISIYGRNSSSGTYGYFKSKALFKGDYKDSVKEQPGSASVVQGVARDKYAIGYSGIGYKTADVKVLRVSLEQGGEAFPPEGDYAYSGDYPIARFLYIYLNYDARKGLDPLRAEFVKLVFSKQGQEVVVKDGYIPVTADIAREDLENLGITPGF
ncbi:MAG: PstS family phosphate ABC transporter substrate-binding protein [Planctomycetes bacterium]|nr:PstS family phosphate ABC transporter substrate-binding protein [Planctomycetota bacterium]